MIVMSMRFKKEKQNKTNNEIRFYFYALSLASKHWGLRWHILPWHLFCTDSASLETCWYLYLYSQQHSRLCGDTGPPKDWEKKSPHKTVFIFLNVCTALSARIKCKCMFKVCRDKGLSVLRSTSVKQSVTTYGHKKTEQIQSGVNFSFFCPPSPSLCHSLQFDLSLPRVCL